MKHRILIATVLGVLLLLSGILYAANGDLMVNGNLGVGVTGTPAGKAEVNGNMVVDGNLGVGTPTPAQKLSVAGTIQSTTGGIMYPDGTTQTTAAQPSTAGQLVWDYTVTGSAATSLTSPTLDGNAHGGYELEAYFVNAGSASIRLYANGDNANTDYYFSLYGVGGGYGNDAYFGNFGSGGTSVAMKASIIVVNNHIFGIGEYLVPDLVQNTSLFWQTKTSVSFTNLTKLMFYSVGNGFGVGSRVRLYRRK